MGGGRHHRAEALNIFEVSEVFLFSVERISACPWKWSILSGELFEAIQNFSTPKAGKHRNLKEVRRFIVVVVPLTVSVSEGVRFVVRVATIIAA